jgi:hypothetical protein
MNHKLIAVAVLAMMTVIAYAGTTAAATTTTTTPPASSSVPPSDCTSVSATGGKTLVAFPCGTSDGSAVGLMNGTTDAPPNYVPKSSTLTKSSSTPKP